jgi:primase-like protein/DNA primase RepB-like protein
LCLLHSTLAEHAEELTPLNQRGAGVFVLVQEGDGRGRKNENVKRIRAVFREDDGEGKALLLEPHIMVQSSLDKHHRYLLVEGLSEKEFRAVQERLVVKNYGSDKNAEDPARVPRLPGFYHLKDPSRPHRVRIVHESGAQPCTREQILAALPPLAERSRGRSATESTDARIPEGERNATLASWAGSVRRRGMSAAAIEAALLAENTTRCDPPLSELGRLAEAMKSMRPTLTLQKGGASRGQ